MTPPLAPGDRVAAVDTRPHANYLRLGHVYTVDVVAPDGRIGLVEGPARMWDADQFVRVDDRSAADFARRAYLAGETGQATNPE